jgi:predicted secreted protein with PEFG-CTERM motif
MAGNTFSVTFDEAGNYPYFCMVHPWMIGEIIVNDKESTPNSSFYIQTDKPEYYFGEDIIVFGNTESTIPDFVSVKVIPSSSSDVISGTSSLSGHGSTNFDHTFKISGSVYNSIDDYTIEVTHGETTSSTMIHVGYDSAPFQIDLPEGKWCLTEDETKSLMQNFSETEKGTKYISKKAQLSETFQKGKEVQSLDIAKKSYEAEFLNYAPLCATSYSNENNDIQIDNVRAARSVNVDNVLGILNQMKNSDFETETAKFELVNDLEKIRILVWNDQMPEVLDNYINLATSVNEKVKNKEFRLQLVTVIDRNIESTSHTVPEFETLAILVLIVSITSVIAISRKSSINGMNFK